jgi:hypothetical protein
LDTRIFEVLIALALVSIALRGIVPSVRQQLRMYRSRKWPTVQGIVQKGELIRAGPGKYLKLPSRALFGYSYSVGSVLYVGFFVVLTGLEPDQELRRRIEGRHVTVRYDPKKPNISVLVDKELDEHSIVQDPLWLD